MLTKDGGGITAPNNGLGKPRSPTGLPGVQEAEIWFKVKEVEKKDQHSYIIIWSGREGLRMFNTWGLSDEQLKDPKNIWSKFSEQIVLTENFRIHRLELSEFRQRYE